jgi:hypothetical protein
VRLSVNKVAMANDIPWEQVVDHALYVEGKFGSPGADKTYADAIHLNKFGHGELAQALFMRLSYSNMFM